MIINILKGLSAYKGSFGLIRKLKLWKYFGVPIAISLLTAIGIGFLAWGMSSALGALITKIWFWEWGSTKVHYVGNFMGALIVIVLGLILYRHVVMALSAPFMSPVSEKIEKHLYGTNHFEEQSGFAQLLWRGIKINVRNLLLELLLTIPILILGFIPIVGVVSSVLLILVQSYYAGFGNMDYTLERHYSYKDSIQFVRGHRGLAIGNGLIFVAMLMIPVIGVLLVLPLTVTAASISTLSAMEKQRLKNTTNLPTH